MRGFLFFYDKDVATKPKKAVIMGLGVYQAGSGVSAALYFAERGFRVVVTDLKPRRHFKKQLQKLKKYRNIKCVFGRHRLEDFKNADLVFQNPSVPDNSPFVRYARRKKIPVVNDWGLFLENRRNFIIGVTGTKGKSTTASLIFKIVKKAEPDSVLTGNIGASPLSLADKINGKTVIVAELSSWLLRGLKPIKKSPNIAVITNLGDDHLDKYRNRTEYFRDKENIFKFQNKKDSLILNRDNEYAGRLAKKAVSRIFYFSKKPLRNGNGSFIRKNTVFFRGPDKKELAVCRPKDVRLPGEHNLENVLAAVCATMILKIKPKIIRKNIKDFRGIPYRLEFIRKVGGVEYYNDTAATTPEAAVRALDSFPGREIVLIAGGADKKLDYKNFAAAIEKKSKALVLLKGDATDKIIAALADKKRVSAVTDNMKDAVRRAKNLAQSGDIILLSPGAASFNLFKNEFDRGNRFNEAVAKLDK